MDTNFFDIVDERDRLKASAQALNDVLRGFNAHNTLACDNTYAWRNHGETPTPWTLVQQAELDVLTLVYGGFARLIRDETVSCGESVDYSASIVLGDYAAAVIPNYVNCALWTTMISRCDHCREELHEDDRGTYRDAKGDSTCDGKRTHEQDTCGMDDAGYTMDDLAPEALASIREDVESFVESNAADLFGMNPEQAGHDFWLTRNGHGAGFWDRGLGERGDRLSEAAKVYGDSDLYVGDDGTLYVN